MRRASSVVCWGVVSAWVVSTAAGCEPPVYPGESLGTFAVVGALTANECGATAVPALDPLQFTVELRREGALAYWRMHKQPITVGSVMTTGALRFRTESYIPVLADEPALGYPGCALIQTEIVEVRVDGNEALLDDAGAGEGGVEADSNDAGARDGGAASDGGGAVASDGGADSDAGLAMARMMGGDNTITFTVDPATDCTPLLASLGGPWLGLPCSVRYRLIGTTDPTP